MNFTKKANEKFSRQIELNFCLQLTKNIVKFCSFEVLGCSSGIMDFQSTTASTYLNSLIRSLCEKLLRYVLIRPTLVSMSVIVTPMKKESLLKVFLTVS